MDVLDAIHARRTVGTFSDQPVGRDVVARLIDAAAHAPNHHETRPWHFSVLTGEARREMADAVAASLSDAPGAARAAEQKLLRAPVVVVVAQRRGSDDPTIDLEDYAACCCATQNLLLAAQAEGLDAKWSTGKLATYPAAKAHLGLDPEDRIVAYVYLGQRSAKGPAPREEAEAAVEWRGFDD